MRRDLAAPGAAGRRALTGITVVLVALALGLVLGAAVPGLAKWLLLIVAVAWTTYYVLRVEPDGDEP